MRLSRQRLRISAHGHLHMSDSGLTSQLRDGTGAARLSANARYRDAAGEQQQPDGDRPTCL
jgi:hypothetical protein